jgi:hypothetical protein
MGLTVKQRDFAKLVAGGMPQVQAYNQTYGKRVKAAALSRTMQASALARSPQVQAEIDSWRQLLRPVTDLRVLRTETLQNLRWLMTESPSQNVRLAASKILLDHCETHAQREQKLLDRGPVGVETLLGELASLREKQPATLELEATTGDTEPEVQAEAEDDAGDDSRAVPGED